MAPLEETVRVVLYATHPQFAAVPLPSPEPFWPAATAAMGIIVAELERRLYVG